jgi:serine/threonine protein kinase/DNA-binding winged helix-turn-helix (wHTH) protein
MAHFEGFEFDLRCGELRRNSGEAIRLGDQPFRILVLLVEHPQEVVFREEIRKKLWPNDTIVEFEHSISAAMNRLRQALGDSGDSPHYIETLARRGYRWMVPVEWSESNASVALPSQTTAAAEQRTGEGLIGKKVSHYRILELLGGGGMGVVYRAEDLRLGRSVAVKFLGEELTDDKRAVERFEHEARAISALDHPNICTIYEVEEHDGQPFIVMQLLQGQTLRQRIEACPHGQSAFSRRELLDVASQIVAGLDAAHQKGIVHRDIKPANIFLTHRGEVKLLDFGLAKLVDTSGDPNEPLVVNPPAAETREEAVAAASHLGLTLTGATLGTASYMSPEQVRKKPVDARSDLFSFGAVFYEMATGRQAFFGESRAAIHDAILNHTPSSPLVWDPDLPTELESIIGRALEKDREKRYQSASEISADFASVGLLTKGRNPATRKRVWLIGLLIAVVVILSLISLRWRVLEHLLGLSKQSSTDSRGGPVAIAVLPFQNSGPDRNVDFLDVALAEEVGDTLSHVDSFAVRPSFRTVRPPPPGLQYDFQKAGRDLGATTVVTGQFNSDADHLKITLEALDVATNRIFWQDTLLVPEKDSLGMREQIISRLQRGLVPTLGESLGPEEIGTRPTSKEAYDLYLQSITTGRNRSDNREAISMLQRSLSLDPGYAPVWEALGARYFLDGAYGGGGDRMFKLAQPTYEHALMLDPIPDICS